ncbi:hypothetical protein D3273_14715 [Lichenibacterium minor]|uniref:Inovirus Gp2 family protein n=1 Tax=Lichenibacterium minor TaxID=2316528 RepID=A0A4Q2U886_9HYPH|nr:hypothetical protein [Lichenibacterium minor]RYC31146.1 hypothetical protein D3273_14715 [Lichenibacterium minor]
MWKLEPISAAVLEDQLRVSILRRQAKLILPESSSTDAAKAMSRLASRIEKNTRKKIGFETLASSRCARRWKIRLGESVREILSVFPNDQIAFFTIVPNARWEIAGQQLSGIKAASYLERLRQQLIRVGLSSCTGIIIARLHGEYDPTRDVYQLHVHMLAAGDTVAVVERLRRLPVYRRPKDMRCAFVKKPIFRQPLRDLKRQLSYHLGMSFWPSKPSYYRDGVLRRAAERRRLPSVRLAEFLVWLDSQTQETLNLFYGCRGCGQSIVRTRREYPQGE